MQATCDVDEPNDSPVCRRDKEQDGSRDRLAAAYRAVERNRSPRPAMGANPRAVTLGGFYPPLRCPGNQGSAPVALSPVRHYLHLTSLFPSCYDQPDGSTDSSLQRVAPPYRRRAPRTQLNTQASNHPCHFSLFPSSSGTIVLLDACGNHVIAARPLTLPQGLPAASPAPRARVFRRCRL